jgi:hypothetical protein
MCNIVNLTATPMETASLPCEARAMVGNSVSTWCMFADKGTRVVGD